MHFRDDIDLKYIYADIFFLFSSTELFILFQLADCLYVLPLFFAEPNSTRIAANSELRIKALKSILLT